jgi:hypothetical protein
MKFAHVVFAVRSFAVFLLSMLALAPDKVLADTDCTYNGRSRDCRIVMPWYRSKIAVPPGEDVLIVWPDGERTAIKSYGSGGWKVGDYVRLNASIPGRVASVNCQNGACTVYIRSSSGNTFSFPFGD